MLEITKIPSTCYLSTVFVILTEKRDWDISVKTRSQMSIRKTGIALWRGSGFFLRTIKKENEMFCPSLFCVYDLIAVNSFA